MAAYDEIFMEIATRRYSDFVPLPSRRKPFFARYARKPERITADT